MRRERAEIDRKRNKKTLEISGFYSVDTLIKVLKDKAKKLQHTHTEIIPNVKHQSFSASFYTTHGLNKDQRKV